VSEQAEEGKPEKKRRKNAATLLAEIATEIYDLHRTADSHGTSGEVVSEGHVYAVLKDDPSRRFDLADIRDDITAMYQLRYESVPSRTALGDAMTVLRGQARRLKPDQETAGDAADRMLAASGITPALGGWDSKDAASSYEVRGGALGWHRPVKDGGTVWTPLATFDAKITAETIRDDGAEQTLTWTVSVSATDGRSGDIEILPDQLGKPQQWAAKAAGVSALVMPGLSVADHLRVAVQSRSGDVPRRIIYAHTGWRRIDGSWAYLTGSGALGARGLDTSVTVDLGPLDGYRLPDVPGVRDVRDAVRKTLSLMEIASGAVMVPVLAAVYRAPLPLPPDCAVWLFGRSGTLKTAVTALAQQHYGPSMDAHGLPGNWTSTANALEAQAFMLDSALYVVDDYSPDATKVDAQRRAATADRLVRGSANHSGRGRLRPDGTQRPAKPPRAQVLTSAEDVPPGVESMRARAFVAEISPGDVNLPRLTAAQGAAAEGTLAVATAAYVQWLARRYDADSGLPRKLGDERTRLRDSARAEGHPRYALNIGSLALGWHEFLTFAAEAGAITAEQREATWSQTWKALVDTGAEQARYGRDADPVRIYLQSLTALITQGRACLADTHGRAPADAARWGWKWDDAGDGAYRTHGDVIGWIEGDDIYLQPDAAYTAARRFAETSLPLTTTKHALHKQMHERGLLASIGKDRLTTRKRVVDGNPSVLHITASTFDYASDQ
jgi:hypothetical protein